MKTRAVPRHDDESLDAFYRGRIRILQKKKGYRFSVDAPLLADFIRTKESDLALELGTGCGVISLLLSVKPFRHITALEIQPALADLARRNVALNDLEQKITVIEEDWRAYRPERRYDLIFSNPPYIRKATGFLSRTTEKAIAKHELRGDIGELMMLAAEWLAPGGRACFIYPGKRRRDFMEAAENAKLKIRLFRDVRPRENTPANLFLCEVGFLSESFQEDVLSPLVLFNPDGGYTDEVEAIFTGRV